MIAVCRTIGQSHCSCVRQTAIARRSGGYLLSCTLQRLDIDLAHLEHGRHDPLRLFPVRIFEQFGQHVGSYLPRHAELVLQPAAWAWLAALGEAVPELVDLFLRL